jgi:hypothetical protein
VPHHTRCLASNPDPDHRFTANFTGNAGRNRGILAVLLGTIIIACGCLPIVFSVLSARADADANADADADARDRRCPPLLPCVPYMSRLARLASIPVLWFGFFTLCAGLQGVCIIIFLFGDLRQLHPYELAKPKISRPIGSRPRPSSQSVYLRGLRGLGEDKFTRGRSESLVSGKGGEIDTDDGNSFVLKPSALITTTTTGTESRMSLDELHVQVQVQQDGRTRTPVAHARPRISVDITQRRSASEVVEISLKRTVDEDIYGIDAAPLSVSVSDRTIAVDAGIGPHPHPHPHHHDIDFDADAGADAPYRFDFDALPLPAGMTLPPWPEALRSGQPMSGAGMRQRRGARGALVERKVFAPLTRVLNPLVNRTQWIIFVRSALIGLVLACTVGGASMAID